MFSQAVAQAVASMKHQELQLLSCFSCNQLVVHRYCIAEVSTGIYMFPGLLCCVQAELGEQWYWPHHSWLWQCSFCVVLQWRSWCNYVRSAALAHGCRSSNSLPAAAAACSNGLSTLLASSSCRMHYWRCLIGEAGVEAANMLFQLAAASAAATAYVPSTWWQEQQLLLTAI
jgi:hypothetical protein